MATTTSRKPRKPRKLCADVSVIDDARVDGRTLSLALRAFGSRAYFDGKACKGSSRDRNGKRIGCVQGHAKNCRGGRDYWYLLDFKGFASEVKGTGSTPSGALRDALARRESDRARWSKIDQERALAKAQERAQ